MQNTNEIAEIAGLLHTFGAFVVGLVIIILLLRRGSIKKLFFGRSGEENYDDWLKSHKKAKQSREEAKAILLANGVDPKDIQDDK